MSQNSYANSGVSLTAGEETVVRLKEVVKTTHNQQVLAGVGAFAGLFALDDLPEHPVLVASTDGVGTKVVIAEALGSYQSIGKDLVNHCLNDLACAGAGLRPLFFLDYIASGRLDPHKVAEIVSGMAEACASVGCAILGGETAEMPSVYQQDAFDVVGTVVGLVSGTQCYPRSSIQAGDCLLALPSSGAHTNGYSLIRQIFDHHSWQQQQPGLGHLGQALLEPHRCYLADLKHLESQVTIKALAHITGGGIAGNLPRVLPEHLTAMIDTSSWSIPPLFKLIERQGQLERQEMFRVFNMGVGMIAIISKEQQAQARALLPDSFVIGEVAEGQALVWH